MKAPSRMINGFEKLGAISSIPEDFFFSFPPERPW
jgi:hypothetical protein